MAKFLIRCIVFFILVITLLLGAWLIPDSYIGESFHYSIIDKHAALDSLRGQRRFLIIGGSNASFGVYSPLIQEATGLPTINTSISAGYGLKYMLRDLESTFNPGDVLLLLPEYSHFLNDGIDGGRPLAQSILINPKNLSLLDANQIQKVVSEVPTVLTNKILRVAKTLTGQKRKKSVYDRDVYNGNYDVIAHWGVPAKKFPIRSLKGEVNKEAFIMLEEFLDHMEKQNIQVFISYPSLNRSSLNITDTALVSEIEHNLHLLKVPILGTPKRYSFPDSLYFNTHYHLTKAGQVLRTQYLLEDLQSNGCCRGS